MRELYLEFLILYLHLWIFKYEKFYQHDVPVNLYSVTEILD
jgi:hypothetical protein